jgi:hypothetical protein
VQLRKLYDPQQFWLAKVLPLYRRVFGSNRSRVCALGVEPNPAHTRYLRTLNAYFRARGYQALVLTETAVSTAGGRATLHTDPGNPVEWGASLTLTPGRDPRVTRHHVANVSLLDLPRLLAGVVLPLAHATELGTGRRVPLLMKLDVEGAEYAQLPALMLNGALCRLDAVYYESHDASMASADGLKNTSVPALLGLFDMLRRAAPACKVQLLQLDDESYLHGDRVPFPRWRRR